MFCAKSLTVHLSSIKSLYLTGSFTAREGLVLDSASVVLLSTCVGTGVGTTASPGLSLGTADFGCSGVL